MEGRDPWRTEIAQIARVYVIDMERKVTGAIIKNLTAQRGEWERLNKLDF